MTARQRQQLAQEQLQRRRQLQQRLRQRMEETERRRTDREAARTEVSRRSLHPDRALVVIAATEKGLGKPSRRMVGAHCRVQ